MGKYFGYVVDNSDLSLTCPYKGCIRAVCPDLFGWKSPIPPIDGLPFAMLKPLMQESSWIRPHWTHPQDFYVPAVGEGVYIEILEDKDLEWCIWTGFFPGSDFINMWTALPMAGINKNVSANTDRIIGTRAGHQIKFEDTPAGGILIEVLGKSITNPAGNMGPKIDMKPSTVSIKDVPGNEIKIAASEITIKTAAGDEVSLAATGITIKSSLGSEIDLNATGIKLKSGDAAAWCPNGVPNCIFSGAPHGGTAMGIIKLTGG